jgi:hypothetical protein
LFSEGRCQKKGVVGRGLLSAALVVSPITLTIPFLHGLLDMALEEHFPDHELHQLGDDRNRDRDPQEVGSSTAISHLPRADGGRAAWLFLFGSFMIEMFLWGFPFSFGVLQDYYTNHKPISLHPAGVSAVGTTCSVRLSSLPHVPS